MRQSLTRSRLVGLLILPLLPAVAAAQGTVRGVVHDSLLTGEPVAEALVTIPELGARTRTDARGRFEFAEVPAGNYTVRYHAPWLDSLSLPPLTAPVRIRTSRTVRVTLGTPSVAAYHRAVCGATFSVTEGVVRGEVRDGEGRPVPGVFVASVWTEAIMTTEGIGGRVRGSIDTTDAHGFYALCGVPRDAEFNVRAGDDTLGTGELTVGLGDRPVLRRDLVIGTRAATARILGRVTTPTGTPIASVVITVAGDSLLGARADSSGHFVIDGLPQRSGQLFVRSVGYTPRLVSIDAATGEIDLPDIVLETVPQQLDEVRVVGARTLAELAFLQRKNTAVGVFLDEDELRRYPAISANVLAAQGGGVRSSGGAWPQIRLRSGGSIQTGATTCAPRFFLDGTDFGIPLDGMDEADLLRRAKRIEIHPAPFMPPEYTDFNGCGVVLIWTK